MVKVILIFVVLFTSSVIGFIYGEIFRKRPLDLKECFKGIMLLQNQVLFNCTPLPEALEDVARKVSYPYNEILAKVASDLLEGGKENVFNSFEDVFIKYEKESYLTSDDLKILSDFLNSLGESGIYGQEKVFNLALENLKINISEADEVSKKNTKLYRYLGICFGTMIAILII